MQSSKPARTLIEPSEPVGNDGFDNENGDLILHYNDEIIDEATGKVFLAKIHLGHGEFGHVYKVSLKGQKISAGQPLTSFAMKISRNDPDALEQFECEGDVLNYIFSSLSEDALKHVCRFESFFIYHNHACLVTEALGPTLLKILQERKFAGLGLDLVQSVLKDILATLAAFSEIDLIHTDVKPENILQQNMISKHVKLIDYGNACSVGEDSNFYIQSRFYRSPEVILNLPFDGKIDVWSLGCVAAELMLGLPLLPGQDERHQLFLINKMFGPFPKEMLANSPIALDFFSEDGVIFQELEPPDFRPYFVQEKLNDIILGYPIRPDATTAYKEKEMQNRSLFVNLLTKMLKLDPQERISAKDALNDPFLEVQFEED
ncbi:putative dual specificity protein kinase YAK1 like protein [Tritrichomonas foetus]|uniref:Dual specificity protein kinase YAK1 like protein n=1 Tax=Tritrichomonas foetus TaxID=1144522 RepID=A0A1J4K3G2_9EUKA|nr:putative dual specificity protein kinase YAK1 like protein [Tritrichomonas foetus]|eukprot:OHT04029.1 putative dual specificity protein kinase YAK1 like protein [Tritrichomonas foetus]